MELPAAKNTEILHLSRDAMLNTLSTGEDDKNMLRTSRATSARIGNFDLFFSQNLHLALKFPCGTLVGTS